MTPADRDDTTTGPRGTREEILSHLRRGQATVEDLTGYLRLTPNAVRVQLGTLERDGLVRRVGKRPGTRRPAILYGLTEEAERGFSRAYVPVLRELLRVLAGSVDRRTTRRLLRRTGERLAAAYAPDAADREAPRNRAELARRIDEAVKLFSALGASVELEAGHGTVLVRGHGCPLGDVVKESACACLVLERLLQALLGTPVEERCAREDHPRCRFRVTVP